MNSRSILERMRQLIPDNPRIVRNLTEYRIRLLDRTLLPEAEARAAEKTPETKRQAVLRWERRHPRKAGKLEKQISRFCAGNPEVWNRIQADPEYLADMKFHSCAYGFLPYEYICCGLDGKTAEERKAFVSDLERKKLVYRMNDIRSISLLADKARAYALLKDYYQRECMEIRGKRDYGRFLDFLGRHPVFVRKPVNGQQGQGVVKEDTAALRETAGELFARIRRQGRQMAEELICQSEALAALNDAGVNTVRCTTVLTKEGPEILFTGVTVGRAGSFVNNGGAGGILVGIDPDTGMLVTEGVDENACRYEAHPDSGIPFRGYRLPEWQELVRICKEAAVKAGGQGCRYVGWDMAHSKDHGWVIVEGNGGGQMIGAQIMSRKGIRPRIDDLMQRI